MISNPPHKFRFIEVGRGMAALLVVFHHIGNIIAQPRFLGSPIFGGHLGNFNVGVDFFFVLSGFIITWMHWDDLGRSNQLPIYAQKRFVRIYPPYWAILFPLILYYLVAPEAGFPSQHDLLNTLLSVFLLPNTVQPVLGVAWTLTYEVFFYLLFAMIIVVGRRGLWLLPIWVGAILAAWPHGPFPFPLTFVLSPYNLEFVLGAGAAILLRHCSVPAAWLVLAAGLGMFASMMFFGLHLQDDILRGRMLFGLSSALIILGSVQIERRRDFIIPRVLMLMGSSSYAIYLVHPLVLALSVKILWRISSDLPVVLMTAVLAVICVGVGVVYHLSVERRLISATRRLFDAARRRPLSVSAPFPSKEV